MTLLVTGATGFVGHALCRRLTDRGVAWRGSVRTAAQASAPELVPVGDLGTTARWDADWNEDGEERSGPAARGPAPPPAVIKSAATYSRTRAETAETPTTSANG